MAVLDQKTEAIMRLTDLLILVVGKIQEVKAMSDDEAKVKLPTLKEATDKLVSEVTL